MQAGLIIEYRYEGDEDAWRAAVDAFVGSVRSDDRLTGRFSYTVFREAGDPARRVHIPQWDSPETLAHVQSQPWFAAFAGKVKEFAGDTPATRKVRGVADSRAG